MAQNLKFIVTDPVGLYATPTTELVNAVKQFHSDVLYVMETKKSI